MSASLSAALQDSEAFARALLESTIDCVIVLDLAGQVQLVNRAGLGAMETGDLDVRTSESWSSLWPAEVADEVARALAAAQAGGNARFLAFCPTRKGAVKWWDVTVSPILGPEGKPDRLLAILRDVSALKRSEDELEHSRAEAEVSARRLENVLASTTDGVVSFDRDMRFIYLNRQARKFFTDGIDPLGKTHREVFPGQEYDEIRRRYEEAIKRQKPAQFERYVPASDAWIEFHVYPSADGVCVFFRDVSDRHRAQERLHHLAHHDTLTGLANRELMRERIEQRLSSSSSRQQTAVLFLDLDNFKSVNDRFGHRAGDQVLILAAERLKGVVRSSDDVGRFGGDEFVVAARVSGREEASALAERIITSLSKPYEIEGRNLTTGVSIGIAIVSEPGAAVGDVKRDADIALYRAKSEGRGIYRVFEQKMGQSYQEREELKQDLRGAAARGEFHLVYQPLIDLATSRVNGFEALLRWEHPGRGAVPPLTFIPLAEESGDIVELGEWVLTTACREAVSWPPDIALAVNLSPIQFHNGQLPETVARCLSASGLPASRLQLEITESVLLANTEGNLEILNDLRRLGASISMDDFGTGYSSLGYLRRFPVDKVKIDRSFIDDLAEKGEGEADPCTIVRAIVDLARNLGLVVTAEGVETQAQADLLRGMGCHEAQGYLFSRPVAADEIAEVVSRPTRAAGEVTCSP